MEAFKTINQSNQSTIFGVEFSEYELEKMAVHTIVPMLTEKLVDKIFEDFYKENAVQIMQLIDIELIKKTVEFRAVNKILEGK